MSVREGEVLMAGTIAGAEAAWPVSEAALSRALEAAGCPNDCLRIVREGGWITIEPAAARHSTMEFGQDAGVAIGQAVRELAQGRALSEEWGSTLRVTTYGKQRKTETLVGMGEDGIHVVSRESPWQPVPQAGAREWFARYGLIAILLTIALTGFVWMQWDTITQQVNDTLRPSSEEGADETEIGQP